MDVDEDVELLASTPRCEVNTTVIMLHICMNSHSTIYEPVRNLVCRQNVDLGVRSHVYVRVYATCRITLVPSYVQEPNLSVQYCLSYGNQRRSKMQDDSSRTGGTYETVPSEYTTTSFGNTGVWPRLKDTGEF